MRTFLDAGGALEATARALFVHANTVRYRLRRVAEVCGEAPTDPRGASRLRVALTLGRLGRRTSIGNRVRFSTPPTPAVCNTPPLYETGRIP